MISPRPLRDLTPDERDFLAETAIWFVGGSKSSAALEERARCEPVRAHARRLLDQAWEGFPRGSELGEGWAMRVSDSISKADWDGLLRLTHYLEDVLDARAGTKRKRRRAP